MSLETRFEEFRDTDVRQRLVHFPDTDITRPIVFRIYNATADLAESEKKSLAFAFAAAVIVDVKDTCLKAFCTCLGWDVHHDAGCFDDLRALCSEAIANWDIPF